MIWAIDQDIVYSAAYSPRLFEFDLLVQKVFINGIENISPNEMNKIEITAAKAIAGRIFNNENANPVIIIPIPTKNKGGFFPSILLMSSISTPTISSPFIAIKPPINCSLKFHSDFKNTGWRVKS
jgi:hypothetical protein